jgi:hypothetical protein
MYSARDGLTPGLTDTAAIEIVEELRSSGRYGHLSVQDDWWSCVDQYRADNQDVNRTCSAEVGSANMAVTFGNSRLQGFVIIDLLGSYATSVELLMNKLGLDLGEIRSSTDDEALAERCLSQWGGTVTCRELRWEGNSKVAVINKMDGYSGSAGRVKVRIVSMALTAG